MSAFWGANPLYPVIAEIRLWAGGDDSFIGEIFMSQQQSEEK